MFLEEKNKIVEQKTIKFVIKVINIYENVGPSNKNLT